MYSQRIPEPFQCYTRRNKYLSSDTVLSRRLIPHLESFFFFELWCWRRLLRVLWTARSSNQSILKDINPEYSLVGLMLKLKLQYFGHLMRRADSLGKTLMLGKIEDKRRGDDRGWGGWMASSIQCTWVWASSGRWWKTEKPGVLQFMGLQRVRHDWGTEQQQQWLIYIRRNQQNTVKQLSSN